MTNVETAVKFPIDENMVLNYVGRYLTADLLFFIFLVPESKKSLRW